MNILTLALLLGVVLLVVAIGLQARLERPLLLLERPGLALRAMVAMYLLQPAFVLLLIWMLPLPPTVSAVLLGFAVSPVLPPWARKATSVGGRSDAVIGLQLLSSGVALLIIPLMIGLVCRLFAVQTSLDPLAVEVVLLVTVAAPLALGMALARLAPGSAPRFATQAERVGGVLLLGGGAFLLVLQGPAMLAAIGQGTLAAIAAVVVFGLLGGHLLGGPDPGDRGVLATAMVNRHPAIALLLASGSGQQPQAAVIATVLLTLLVALVLSIPYERWRRQRIRAASDAVRR